MMISVGRRCEIWRHSEQYNITLVKRVTELKRRTTNHAHVIFQRSYPASVVCHTVMSATVFEESSRRRAESFNRLHQRKMIRSTALHCVWAFGLCGLYCSFADAVVAKSTNASSPEHLRNSVDGLETSQTRVNQVDGYRFTGSGSENHVSGKGK